MGALHHFGRPGASRGNHISLHMEPPQKAETDHAVEDQKDRDDEVEKPRHDQDQKAGDDGYDRRDMGDGEGHLRASPLTFLHRIEECHLTTPCRVLFHDRRRFAPQPVPRRVQKMTEMCSKRLCFFTGTMLRAMNWIALQAATPACNHAHEQNMRNHLLAIAAVTTIMSPPMAAQAQNTVGVAGPVVVDDGTVGIALEQRPAFRQYIVRERVPSYTIPDRVIVGGILPDSGVTIYDVPQSFGATPYRYTVVNGQTVLVEPRTRRIVQVLD